MATAPPVPEYDASVSSLARVQRYAPSPHGLQTWLVLGGFQAHRLLELGFKDRFPGLGPREAERIEPENSHF